MKGVFIKGASLPKSCFECPCMAGGICFVAPSDQDGLIADTVEELRERGGKPDWCPMVEAEIDKTEPVKDWISVKDRLPDDGVEVLVYDTDCGVLIGWYDKKDNIFVCEFINQLDAVTHWQPLPEPPKGEGDYIELYRATDFMEFKKE